MHPDPLGPSPEELVEQKRAAARREKNRKTSERRAAKKRRKAAKSALGQSSESGETERSATDQGDDAGPSADPEVTHQEKARKERKPATEAAEEGAEGSLHHREARSGRSRGSTHEAAKKTGVAEAVGDSTAEDSMGNAGGSVGKDGVEGVPAKLHAEPSGVTAGEEGIVDGAAELLSSHSPTKESQGAANNMETELGDMEAAPSESTTRDGGPQADSVSTAASTPEPDIEEAQRDGRHPSSSHSSGSPENPHQDTSRGHSNTTLNRETEAGGPAGQQLSGTGPGQLEMASTPSPPAWDQVPEGAASSLDVLSSGEAQPAVARPGNVQLKPRPIRRLAKSKRNHLSCERRGGKSCYGFVSKTSTQINGQKMVHPCWHGQQLNLNMAMPHVSRDNLL